MRSPLAGNRLRRRNAVRAPYKRVLIVTEGEKTEPNYFSELIVDESLATANVIVDGSSGSSPLSVVDHGVNAFNRDRKKFGKECFDRVYFVIDRDRHSDFDRAVDKVSRMRPADKFVVVPSYPCFEYWFLLHFGYTRKPYVGSGGKSPCEEVMRDLERKLGRNYEKCARNTYCEMKPRLDTAIRASERAVADAASTGQHNPSTKIHELVKFLRNLKNQVGS